MLHSNHVSILYSLQFALAEYNFFPSMRSTFKVPTAAQSIHHVMAPKPISTIMGDVVVVVMPFHVAHQALSTWEVLPLVNLTHCRHFPCTMKHYFLCYNNLTLLRRRYLFSNASLSIASMFQHVGS